MKNQEHSTYKEHAFLGAKGAEEHLVERAAMCTQKSRLTDNKNVLS